MDRRYFLWAGMSVAAISSGLYYGQPGAFAASDKKVPIALQLYSLRRTIKDDVPGTLKKVAAMGYTGVETAGTYGLKAEELKKMLDDVGLKAISAHIGLGAVLGDAYQQTVEYNKILGNDNLIVPGGLEPSIVHDASNSITASLFNELADKAKADGMFVGFHCHTGDFRKVEDKKEMTAWELFMDRTKPEVLGEIDIGWCNNSGNDPAKMIRKYPGRAKLVHVKSNNNEVKGCVVAEAADKVNWKNVFEACETAGGTQWYIVEQEQFRVSELESVKECIDNLKKLGK